MKKVLLAIMMVMFYTQSAFGAYDNTAVCTPSTVDNNRTTYSCAFVDSVAGSATEETRINADAKSGRIVEVYWTSASEDCDIWISNAVDSAVTSSDRIYSYSTIVYGMFDTLNPAISYFNTLGKEWLYVTIKNDGAIATGTAGILKITYERP